MLVAACGSSDDSGGGGGGGGEQADSITIIKTNMGSSLDPALMSPTSYIFGGVGGNAIFDSLIWIDTDGNINYSLAKDLATEDGKKWTLTLNEGIEFSDGTPFNAEAVKFTWTRLTDPELGSNYISTAGQITSMKVIDDLTLEFTLAGVNFTFPYTLNGTGLNWIVPLTADDDRTAFARQPIGAGPFKVESWSTDNTVELVKNANYFRADEGLPKLERITVLDNPDSSTATDIFLSGEAQLRSSADRMRPEDLESVDATALSVMLQGGAIMAFNTTKPPFDDVRARRAVAAALDTKLFSETATGGLEPPAETIVAPGSIWEDPNLVQTYDPELAQQLFDELADEGKPVEFAYRGNPTTQATGFGQWLTATLGEFDNVKVDVTSGDIPAYVEDLTSGNFQTLIISAQGAHPDTAFYDAFTPGSYTNWTKWDDPEAAAALVAGRSTADQDEQVQAYLTFQERVIDQVPVLFLIHAEPTMELAKGLEGVVMTADGRVILTEATYTP